MSIGSYRHRVRLENPGPPVPDGLGGYTEATVALDPVEWDCAIGSAATRAIERLAIGLIQATSTHIVRGRYHPGITTETRVLFEKRGVLHTLQVQSVTNVDERDAEVVLVCAEVVGGGSEPTSDRRARGATGSAPRVTPGFGA